MPSRRRISAAAVLGFFAGGVVVAALSVAVRPEREAHASQHVLVVANESCSHTYTSGSQTLSYAEHAYPGLTMHELASIQIVGHLSGQQSPPAGYSHALASASPFVRDGAVAVVCGDKAASRYDSVTFLLPE